jgi:hypothetical protein
LVYEAQAEVSFVFHPNFRLAIPGLTGAVYATMALLSGRRPFWATTCLAAGYASESDDEAGLVAANLAREEPGVDRWRESGGVLAYCASYENLGWDSRVIVDSARMITAALPAVLVSAAARTIPDLQICLDRYDGDTDKVLECYRNGVAGQRDSLSD